MKIIAVESDNIQQTCANVRSSFEDSGRTMLASLPVVRLLGSGKDLVSRKCQGSSGKSSVEERGEDLREEERRRSKRGVGEREIKGSEEAARDDRDEDQRGSLKRRSEFHGNRQRDAMSTIRRACQQNRRITANETAMRKQDDDGHIRAENSDGGGGVC